MLIVSGPFGVAGRGKSIGEEVTVEHETCPVTRHALNDNKSVEVGEYIFVSQLILSVGFELFAFPWIKQFDSTVFELFIA